MKRLLHLLENLVQLVINLNSLLKLIPPQRMELNFKDTQKLLEAIQELYTLRDLNTFGITVLKILNQLVQSEIPEFHVTCVQSRQISHTFLPSFPGFTSEIDEVVQHHFAEHPIACNMPHTLESAHKISDFISEKEFHRLEGLYQRFMRRLDIEDQITCFLPPDLTQSWDGLSPTNVPLVGISLHRNRRSFTERDRLILNLLRPHLFQAYSNAQHYHQLQQNLAQLQLSLNCLDLVILDCTGRIQLSTPQATQWLRVYFAEPTDSLQLPNHLWAWVKYQVACLAQNPSNVCLPLRIQRADKQLLIRLIFEQTGERYLLLLEEQTLSLFKALELLGLSQRETEVLFWIIQGKDNKAIAKALALQSSTVRKHLESIYDKLGVQSRTEAIAQALEKLGYLNSQLLI